MTQFRGRYRVESTRLPGWDYTLPGYYFVTICTRNRACVFGDLVNDEIRLSAAGETATRFWQEIPQHIAGTGLDEFIVMPNHLHGIVILGGTDNHRAVSDERDIMWDTHEERDGRARARARRDVACYVSTNVSTNVSKPPKIPPPAPGSLGAIIRSYKSAVTVWCRKHNHPFAWQPRFYDQIIRDEKSLAAIRTYIRDNPLRWTMDREFPS